MKIRNGFVSNSSSSSFVCEVSGTAYVGYDGEYEDGDYYGCENGHSFEGEYLQPPTSEPSIEEMREKLIQDAPTTLIRIGYQHASDDLIQKWYEETFDDDSDYIDDNSCVPSDRCPICQFVHISVYDLPKYLLWKTGQTKGDVLKEIKNNFGSYKNFSAAMKKKRPVKGMTGIKAKKRSKK